MKKITLISLLSFVMFSTYLEAEIIFWDNFETYQNGSDGSPIWHITKGFWQIKNSTFIQKSLEYDCGALIDIYLDCSFQLEVQFRVLEGEPGAGFFFSCEDITTTEFSQMCRLESEESMLLGYFVLGGFQATKTTRFAKQDFLKWHTLKLIVNQDSYSYSTYLDQQKLEEDVTLNYATGYWGLQSSGGVIQFDNVKLTKIAMKRKPRALSWPRHFIINDEGQLVIPHRAGGIIQVFNLQGECIKRFGMPRKQRGQLQYPYAIEQLQNGDYLISDIGTNRIHVFGKTGKWKASVEKGKLQFDYPADIAIDNKNRIYVADQNNNLIQILNDKLKFVKQIKHDKIIKPSAVACFNDKVFILSSGTNYVEIFQIYDDKISWRNHFRFGNGRGRDLVVDKDYIYVSTGNSVKLFNNNFEFKKEFTAKTINGCFPFGLHIDADKNIFIADFTNDRIIITDYNLLEPIPIIDFPKRDQAKITFHTTDMVQSNLIVYHAATEIYNQLEAQQKKDHLFLIKDLAPSTTYHYQLKPTIKSIPPDTRFSRKFPFITPPIKGKKHYWQLPIATIIFTNVIDTATIKPDWPKMLPLEDREIERIKAQINDGVFFYWVNSKLNLFVDNEFVIVNDFLYSHQIFDKQSWHPPLKGSVKKYLQRAGKNVNSYCGILYLACVRDYDEKKGKYVLRGKGGAFTMGWMANQKYGISYWEVTHKNHNSGNNWLMVHEFHHQLDELFLVSGYPEYWFNHFSPTINTAADFGEHFDGNAWILRNWPYFNWYDLKFGEIQLVDDVDEDGIPDNAPQLPLDEVRLQSSPNKKDTDDDGLLDFDELKISNWIIEGCGESYHSNALFPKLYLSDTDEDGIIDSEDPYPIYPFEPKIKYSTDTVWNESTWSYLARLTDNKIHARVYANWDSSSLYFAFKEDRLAPIKLMLDADADGWFLGKDNYQIKLSPNSDGKLETKVDINNCAEPKKWPFFDKDLAKNISIVSSFEKIDDKLLIRLSIPRSEFTGLELKTGEEIGVNIGFQVMIDEDGNKRYVNIFEPNRFFDVKLEVK